MLRKQPKIEMYPEHLRDVVMKHRDDTNVKLMLSSLGLTISSAILFRANFEENVFPGEVTKVLASAALAGCLGAATGFSRLVRDHRHSLDEQVPTAGGIVMRNEVEAANQLEDRIAHLVIQPPEVDGP